MSKVMLALTIALFLWPCTTLPTSAAWRICGSLYNAFCVVEEKSSHPCALALTERGGQTWPDKWAACRAILNGMRNDLKAQCVNRPVPGCSEQGKAALGEGEAATSADDLKSNIQVSVIPVAACKTR
jgi:hypothetical protein